MTANKNITQYSILPNTSKFWAKPKTSIILTLYNSTKCHTCPKYCIISYLTIFSVISLTQFTPSNFIKYFFLPNSYGVFATHFSHQFRSNASKFQLMSNSIRFMGCLHDPANVQLHYNIWQQTSSRRPAIHVYFEYICWKFAGSCKHPTNNTTNSSSHRIIRPR